MQRDCDLCKQQNVTTPAIVDRATTMGPWAYLCESHNSLVGVGRATILADLK